MESTVVSENMSETSNSTLFEEECSQMPTTGEALYLYSNIFCIFQRKSSYIFSSLKRLEKTVSEDTENILSFWYVNVKNLNGFHKNIRMGQLYYFNCHGQQFV